MSHHVLIVDDEMAPALAIALTDLAQRHEITLSTAGDGEQCLRIVAESPPDLILLDMQLPVLDGFEVLAELQRRQIVTRIIMMSGKVTDTETIIRCVRAGACDYIVKENLRPHQLLERIRRSLLLSNTSNLSLAALSPLQQELVDGTAQLKREWTELRAENARLKDETRQVRHRLLIEVAHKAGLVGVALCGVLVLTRLGVTDKTAVSFVFIILLIMLLIPVDRVQQIRASVAKWWSGSITLHPAGARSGAEVPRDDAHGSGDPRG